MDYNGEKEIIFKFMIKTQKVFSMRNEVRVHLHIRNTF